MKRAIVSDIHGNLEALEAVLDDAASMGVADIYCLGDMVGYGPNPSECIDRVMTFGACVLGNHDQGALFDPEGFSAGAERAIFWTRDQLESLSGDEEQRLRRWNFLCELPRTLREDGFLYVHGSARNPLNEYVFPEDVHNPRKLEKVFALIEKYSFQGHTHVPGIFTEDGRFLRPDQVGGLYKLDEDKVMVNVGSVGQPRDGDPRSSYAILEDQVVHFRRVEYPFAVTAQKIYDIPELDNFLGDRLREGR